MKYSDLNERELIQYVRNGDNMAAKQLYCRYIGYLTAVCSRYVTGNDNVRDVLQEGFIKIFTGFSTYEYRGDGSLKAWLTRVMVNESLKWLQLNTSFENMQPDSEMPDTEDDTQPDVDDIPMHEIHRMISELPAGYRTVFNLYVFEEKKHKEIATILHIKESSSASQLHWAKKMMAKKIEDYRKEQNR